MSKIRSQITREILETVKRQDKCGKNDIAESIGLQKEKTEKYISTLTEKGILSEHHSKTSYNLTDKGKSLYSSFKKLDDITSISIIF